MNDESLQLVEQTLALCPPGIFQCTLSDAITGDNAGENTGENNNHQSHLKVRTSLLYPGGGPVDVHVRADPREGYIVTDLGSTMNMLGRQLSANTGNASQWKIIAGNICRGLDIHLQGREWTVPARRPEDVGNAAMLLAQAQLRTAIITSIFKITNSSD
jgi:hypothetical protein